MTHTPNPVAALLLSAVIALAGPAAAQVAPADQAAPDRCAALTAGIIAGLKESSYLSAQSVVDRSAPRATMRAQQIANVQTAIQGRLSLMTASGCDPYEGPLDPEAYVSSAMACVDARQFRPGREGPACDRETWQIRPGSF